MKTNTIVSEVTQNATTAKAEVIKLGLDVHRRQITVCVQEDGATPKPPRQMSATALVAWVGGLVAQGSRVISCYEAGPLGYHLHRELTAAGATNYVVAPTVLPNGRRQKTDRLDARALLDRLDRYVRGNRHAFNPVRVPTPEQEQARAQGRLREQLLQDRKRAEARGRSLLLSQGLEASGAWWKPRRWALLAAGLPVWLREMVGVWQQLALACDAQEQAVRQQLEAAAPRQLPAGLGALTWVLLSREILQWSRFGNRRQVASYTGLCPGIHKSDGRGREGSINRCGNPTVRHLLVETVWRLVRWQPQYPPLQRLRAAVSGRQRRKAAVAVARRLAIDLWRLATGQCRPEQLGLQGNLAW